MIVENNIKLIVIDSFGGALAGEINDAEASMQLANALRSLGVTILAIDHVAKGSNASPIGTIYKVNLARNLWTIISKPHEDTNSMEIVLKHTKTNNKKELPRVFYMEFESNEEAFGITDVVRINNMNPANSILLEEIINQEQGEKIG